MKFYTEGIKKDLKDDISDGIDTILQCNAFLARNYEDEKELLLKEYNILTNLSSRIDNSMLNNEEIQINEEEYLILLRWHLTDFETFKYLFAFYSNQTKDIDKCTLFSSKAYNGRE